MHIYVYVCTDSITKNVMPSAPPPKPPSLHTLSPYRLQLCSNSSIRLTPRVCCITLPRTAAKETTSIRIPAHASLPPFPLLLVIAPLLGLCRAPVMMVSTIILTTSPVRGWRWISSAYSPPLTTACVQANTQILTNYATGGWKGRRTAAPGSACVSMSTTSPSLTLSSAWHHGRLKMQILPSFVTSVSIRLARILLVITT